jgi:hypothetical protein
MSLLKRRAAGTGSPLPKFKEIDINQGGATYINLSGTVRGNLLEAGGASH